MKKLRVILIDDELLIRKLIRMKMKMDSLNIEVVGEYANGAEALADIQNAMPDIVISDICMPETDGLTFSEECVKMFPDSKIILVTGYDDFEYARRSIKAGVFDYILKPIKADELNASLERAVHEIMKLRGQKEKEHQFLSEVDKNKSVFRDIYLNKLLANEESDEDMEIRLAEYGVDMHSGAVRALRAGMLVVPEGFYEPDLILRVLEETKAFFQSDRGITVLKDLWNRILIISCDEEIPLAECVDILVSLIKEKYGCRLFAGISRQFGGWKDLRQAYLDALSFIRNTHMEEKGAGGAILEEWDHLAEAIGKGDVEEAQKIIREYFAKTDADVPEQRRRIQGSVQKLCIDLEINQASLLFLKELSWCGSMEQLEYCLGNIAAELTVRKKVERQESSSEVLWGILQFMWENIDREDLSLNFLAAEFSVSSSHLSKMLKSFTGKKYVEIQSDMRLLKMLELLHTTSLRDCDIGRRIGIQDTHYLSIWFKKMMGSSVTEYRKLLGIK